MGNETYRVELEGIEIEKGLFIFAEAEIAISFEETTLIQGYEGEEYPVTIETPLTNGSMVDSCIFIADGPGDDDPCEELHWENDKGLFALAEARIIEWIVSSREGYGMVIGAIEDACVDMAEAAVERSFEAR